MSGKFISNSARSGALLVLLAVSAMALDELRFPRFDGLDVAYEEAAAQLRNIEDWRRRGAPTNVALPIIERIKRRLENLEPHLHPELRRYWAEQGREHAQRDLAKGTLRLFFVIKPLRTEGMLPFRAPPVDEFEALLNDRLVVSLVRVQQPSWREPGYTVNDIAVNTRCDGYNEVVERYCREKHGFDIVSQLWRIAETEAWGTKQPVPTAQEVWFPFGASGASLCLLVGLVLIRRRRERRRVIGFSAALQ